MEQSAAMAPTEEARRIFSTIDDYHRNTKPIPALEGFFSPGRSFDSTPWRRVYMALGVLSTAYLSLTMEPWNPSELWADGARGILWCFTELPRLGEKKVCRTTVDGTQTWSSRTGRAPRNGYPDDIRVDKLVIKDTDYHMLELTLGCDKPTVALCKIWKKGATAEESLQSMNEETSASNHQVEDNNREEAITEMQLDQPQEQQFPMPHHHADSMSDYAVHPNYGQFEGTEQEPQMPNQVASATKDMVHPNSMGGQFGGAEVQVKIPEDGLSTSYYLVHPTEDLAQSTYQDADSIYQGAISYLYEEKDSFRHLVSQGTNEAHEIASTAQSLASTMRNLLNRFTFLGINTEPGNTRPASTIENNNHWIRLTTDRVTEQAIHATEPMTGGEFLEQEMAQQIEEYSMEDEYFNVDEFINLGGGGTN